MLTASDRESRGKQIADLPNQIQRIDEHSYKVVSQTCPEIEYAVFSTELGWTCSCFDSKYRRMCCKHAYAVIFSQELRKTVESSIVIQPLNALACPQCQSQRIVKNGIFHNQNGDLQRYHCKQCGKWFVFNLGFESMKSTPEVICSAMQIYFSGVSLRKTAESLILRGVRVSHVSVYFWISKYVSLMEKYVEQIKPNVSDKWRTDELYLKMKGDKKWLFAVMDDETRFWIAQQVGNHKGVSDIRPMIKEAKRLAEKEPKVIISDAAHNFGVAIAEELPNSKHIGEIRMEGQVHNNKQERLNGELRDREKVMRSLKKKDTPILKGMQIFHNYVRPHMALEGKTPAEKAGIEVKGLNKWMTLIQNASLESRKPKSEFEGI